MAQIMPVPGPSQDDFDALSGQVSTLNSNIIPQKIITGPTNTITLSIEANSRHFIVASAGNSSSRSCALIVDANSSGTTRFFEIAKGSDINVSVDSSNHLVIAFGNTPNYTMDIALNGNLITLV